MSSNEIRFTPYEIKDCLMDRERTNNLRRAIAEKVTDGDIILEAGGGTGILSIFAILAGAKHAYVIEISGRFTDVIRDIAKRNGLEDRITVINGDATKTDIPEMVDVYISELLCTGLFNEPQIQAYNNLTRFFKDDVKCIPEAVESRIAFVEAETKKYGIDIACDSYLASDIIHHRLTDFDPYMNIEFNGKRVPTRIHKIGRVDPLSIGGANAALFVSTARLSPSVDAGQTKFLFNPELVFFKNTYTICGADGNTTVINDEYVDISSDMVCVNYQLQYEAGCDTLDINLRVY